MIKWVSSKGKNLQQKRKPQKRKRKTAGKTIFIICMILVVGAAALYVALGYYVKNLNTVYPNIWANDVDLSGKTLDDAKSALIDAGYESNADGVAATITFPDGSGFTITGDEAGFSMDSKDAAGVAYEYGRSGSFFENEQEYIKAYFTKTELSAINAASNFNAPYVRSVVSEYTRRFNATLIEATYNTDIENDRIIITKGVSIEPADEDAVYDLTVATLNKAMEQKKHLTAEFIPKTTDAKDVDLDLIYRTIAIAPVSAVYDPDTMSITPSSEGVSFDLDGAKAMLAKAGVGDQIIIPLVHSEPDVTEEQLESLLFRDELYTKTTKIAGSNNRLGNIKLAAAAVNGKVLRPGEIFSFNETVGQRTAAKGYTEAGAYVSGEVVLEIGGGICQVSSTIYDCVLHTNLEVVERKNHQFTVAYLPIGNDATVNWGTIDFRFKNNTDYPIRIDAVVGGGDGRDLRVTLVGTKQDDYHYKIQYRNISTTQFKTVEREDPSVTERTVKNDGHAGQVVETYKYIYDKDDNLISEVYVDRSTYRTQDRLILLPVKDPTETPTESEPPVSETPTETAPATEPPSESEPPTSETPTETAPPSESESPTETAPPSITPPTDSEDQSDRQSPDNEI